MLGALRPGNRDNLAQFRQTGSGRKSIAHPRTPHTAFRYCPACDLLIAHQDEVEIALETVLADRTAASAFKDDQIAGTLDRPDFQRALQGQMTMEELIARTRAFTRVLEV